MILSLGIIIAIIIVLAALYFFQKINGSSASENSTAVYNAVAAIGIVVSGLWVFSTFDLLNQRDIAQAQLDELKIKLKSFESSKLELSTEIVDYKGVDNDAKKKGLIIKVKVINVGNTPIEFDLSNYPLKIYKIIASGTSVGYESLFEPIVFSELGKINGSGESTPLTSFVSLTSSERILSYFAVLPTDSMYYIVFSTSADNIEGESVNKCEKESGCKWFVSKYLYIK